jgi:hypothetical protein
MAHRPQASASSSLPSMHAGSTRGT